MLEKANVAIDKRILNTIQSIENALVELMSEGYSHSQISITLLSKRAGITRKALYDRFGNVNQVFISLGTKVFLGVEDLITNEELKLPLAESSLGTTIVKSFAGHSFDVMLFMRNMPQELLDSMVREATANILDRALQVNNIVGLTATEREYLIRYSSGSLSGVVGAWGDRKFSDSPDAVGMFFSMLFFPGVDQLLKQKQKSQFNFGSEFNYD